MPEVTYAVRHLLAHIEAGEAQFAGATMMRTICGEHVDLNRVGELTGLKDPMFYAVCGRCRRITERREARVG